MIVRACVLLLFGLGVFAPRSPVQADEPAGADVPRMLLGGRVLLPDGTLQDDVVVEFRGGKIRRIGASVAFADQAVHRLDSTAVISPGLIDLFATPGAVGHTVEDTDAVEPAASPLRVLDPSHEDFRTALEAGITSVMVGPAATNLVNGVCVTVRTHVKGQFDVLRDDGPLLLAFGEGVWRSDRMPTSRAGAAHDLRELIGQARQGEAHPRINAAVAGKLDAWVACSEKQDVLAVRRALGDAKGHFGLVHSKDALDLIEAAEGLRQPVVLGPYRMSTSRRELLGAAALSKAGIGVAFRAGFPATNAQALRLSAALAVRHGMDPAAARRSITLAPAQVAGVADRVGSIEVGKDADLVVFSLDPLRMDARVLEVYTLGQRVYSSQHQNQEESLAGAQP